MLQKFKITTCAFILCLFGVTLTTVSPVLAEDSKEFKECQLIKPKDTDLALMKKKKDCFRDLARVLSAEGTSSRFYQGTLLEGLKQKNDKISDLEGKLANALVSIMVYETVMEYNPPKPADPNMVEYVIAQNYITDNGGSNEDLDMLTDRHNELIAAINLVKACEKNNSSQVEDLRVCRGTASALQTEIRYRDRTCTDGVKDWDVPCSSVIAELQAKMLKDAALYDDAVRLYKEQQALLTEANTKIIDLDSEVKTREDVQLKTNEVYADVKEKLTAANTKLSALCNHEALAHVRNVKGLLANAEIRRLCNE
jgi:hypothetical protein